MKLIKTTVLIIVIFFTAALSIAAAMDHQSLRNQAQQAYQDGNWRDAFNLYRKLCLEVKNDPQR